MSLYNSQNNTVCNDITAVILARSRDFGRCELASRLSPALWPLFDKPVICNLLQNLSGQGIREAVICCNGLKSLFLQTIGTINSMKISFCEEPFPLGTAGCIRDSAKYSTKHTLLVLSAQTLVLPEIQTIVREHRKNKTYLTVLFHGNSLNTHTKVSKSQFYICNKKIARHIPEKGYFDVKESLIPLLLSKGMQVKAVELPSRLLCFRDRAEYLSAISSYLTTKETKAVFSKYKYRQYADNVMIAPDAYIDPSSRIFGPAIIMSDSIISGNVVIFGPVVIGKYVRIGKNSFIDKSILWDGVNIGNDSTVSNCLADYDASVPPMSIVRNKSLVRHSPGFTANLKKVISFGKSYVSKTTVRRNYFTVQKNKIPNFSRGAETWNT